MNQKDLSLYNIGLSRGIYSRVNTEKDFYILHEEIISDPHNLLGKVINPDCMSGKDHGDLLDVLIGLGFKETYQKFAVGPAIDDAGRTLLDKMRVVQYSSLF